MNNLVQGEKNSNCNAASNGALIRLLFWQRKQQNSRVGTAAVIVYQVYYLDHSIFHFESLASPTFRPDTRSLQAIQGTILSLSLCTLGLIRSNRLLSNGVTSARRPCIPRAARPRCRTKPYGETSGKRKRLPFSVPPNLYPRQKKKKKEGGSVSLVFLFSDMHGTDKLLPVSDGLVQTGSRFFLARRPVLPDGTRLWDASLLAGAPTFNNDHARASADQKNKIETHDSSATYYRQRVQLHTSAFVRCMFDLSHQASNRIDRRYTNSTQQRDSRPGKPCRGGKRHSRISHLTRVGLQYHLVSCTSRSKLRRNFSFPAPRVRGKINACSGGADACIFGCNVAIWCVRCVDSGPKKSYKSFPSPFPPTSLR